MLLHKGTRSVNRLPGAKPENEGEFLPDSLVFSSYKVGKAPEGVTSFAISMKHMMEESMDEQIDEKQDGRADFDFFMGTWKVRNRRLRERLKGSTSWEEFGGKTVARKILGELGNIEEFSMERDAEPKAGMTLRFFNPESGQWSIYLANNVSGFDPQPAIGEFKQGRGEFYSQEFFEGKSIFCRVIWSQISANACHWEQAFSADGGKTWETNWISDFERID